MFHQKLADLLSSKWLEEIKNDLYHYNHKDFYIFLEIYLDGFWLDTINQQLSKIHQENWKIDWFAKNLQACILVKIDNIEEEKKEKSFEIINIEDDEYYANKYVIFYKIEQDIIDYIKSSLPFFYEDFSESSVSLSGLENDIASIHPYLWKELQERDWKSTDEIVKKLIQNIDKLENTQSVNLVESEKENEQISTNDRYIQSIALNNFRNWKHTDWSSESPSELFDLAKTKYHLLWNKWINTLSWPNGLWKTTLYHSIERLLFGKIDLQDHKPWEQSKKKDILCNTETWKSEYYVTWRFITHSWELKIITRKSNGELWLDEQLVDNSFCEYFFGISHSEYKYFMYLPQNDYLWFVVNANKSKRENLLSPLIWIDKYDDIIDKKIWDLKSNGLVKFIENEIWNLTSKLSESISVKTWIIQNPRDKIIKDDNFIKSLPWFSNNTLEEEWKKIAIFLSDTKNRIDNNEDEKNRKIEANYNYQYTRQWSHLDESTKDDYKKVIDLNLSKEDIQEKVKNKELEINKIEKKKNILDYLNNKQYDTKLYETYDFDAIPNIKKLIMQFCTESEKIASQTKDISILERNISETLEYIKTNNESVCPTCTTSFDNSQILIQNIKKSLEKMKTHLNSNRRDELYETIMKSYFVISWKTLEKDIVDWKRKIQEYKWMYDNFEFTKDLRFEKYKVIETGLLAISENNSYISLELINQEYEIYKKIDYIKLTNLIGLFDDHEKYIESQKSNHISGEIEKFRLISNKLKSYKDQLEKRLKKYKEWITNEGKWTIKSYIKSIIKYQYQWNIILEDWQLKIEEHKQIPDFTFSQWQLSAIALGCMLYFYKNIQKRCKLKCLLIDDPIQTIDDLNALNLINLLRYQFKDCQIILSTHEWQFDTLLRYKFKVLWLEEKMIDMKSLHNK